MQIRIVLIGQWDSQAVTSDWSMGFQAVTSDWPMRFQAALPEVLVCMKLTEWPKVRSFCLGEG